MSQARTSEAEGENRCQDLTVALPSGIRGLGTAGLPGPHSLELALAARQTMPTINQPSDLLGLCYCLPDAGIYLKKQSEILYCGTIFSATLAAPKQSSHQQAGGLRAKSLLGNSESIPPSTEAREQASPSTTQHYRPFKSTI